MKKFISIILCSFLAIGSFASPAYAENLSNNSKAGNEFVFYYSDGTYTTTRFISEPETRSSIITKTKAVDYHNANGTVLFSLYIRGTFSIDYGSSVTCTSKNHWYEINNHAWSNSAASSYISNYGNSASATANGTFIRKLLGITINTIDTSVTLNCDKNGNFS